MYSPPPDIPNLVQVISSCENQLINKQEISNEYCLLSDRDTLVSLDLSNLPVFTIRGTTKNLENKIKDFFNKNFEKNQYNKFNVDRNIISITRFTRNKVVKGWEKLQFIIIITHVNNNQIYISVIMDGSYSIGLLDPRTSREVEYAELYPLEISNTKLSSFIKEKFINSLLDALVK